MIRKIAVRDMVMAALIVGAAVVWAGTTASELTSANAQKKETTFGDLATDALRDAAGTTIALIPAVSFRSGSIPAGEVTLPQVGALLTQPAEKWAVVSLTGAKLGRTMARSVSRAPMPNAGFLQVSGIVLTYNPDNPRGSRIVSLMVGGAAVELDRTYQVAMPLSLAKGGSGYFQIFGEDDIARTGEDKMAALIVRYVDAKGSVNYTGQGRIIIGE